MGFTNDHWTQWEPTTARKLAPDCSLLTHREFLCVFASQWYSCDLCDCSWKWSADFFENSDLNLTWSFKKTIISLIAALTCSSERFKSSLYQSHSMMYLKSGQSQMRTVTNTNPARERGEKGICSHLSRFHWKEAALCAGSWLASSHFAHSSGTKAVLFEEAHDDLMTMQEVVRRHSFQSLTHSKKILKTAAMFLTSAETVQPFLQLFTVHTHTHTQFSICKCLNCLFLFLLVYFLTRLRSSVRCCITWK